MTSPYYSDAFLGGGAVPGLEEDAEKAATLASSRYHGPAMQAYSALPAPGAAMADYNAAYDKQAATGHMATGPVPQGTSLTPEQVAAAAAALAPPPAPPTIQDAAAAQVGPPAPVPVPVAAPVARPAGGGGGGFKTPYGSQAGEHLGAVADEGQAEQAENFAKAEAYQTHALALDEQREKQEARLAERNASRARREQMVDQQMADLDARITDASTQAYDSGKFFNTPGAMLMNIGAALGGGAAARVTGRNDAQATLERAIDRDFQGWKANAEQKQSGVREKANLVTQMRATYADRDQADAAAELIHREMAAATLEAEAARSKVPEIQAQGMKMAAAIRDKSATIKDKYNAIATQAALAAEARRRADEKEMFERGLKVAELGVKQKDAETKRLEAEGKSGEKLNEQTSKISSALQTAKIPAALASADRAKADLAEGGSVINSNPIANKFATAMPVTYKFLAGDAAQRSQMSFANFKNEILNQKGGAAISDSELARHLQDLEGAGTPEDKMLAINNVIEALKRGEAAIKAGASPAAVAEYDRRNQALAPTVSATAPKNFTPGIR